MKEFLIFQFHLLDSQNIQFLLINLQETIDEISKHDKIVKVEYYSKRRA